MERRLLGLQDHAARASVCGVGGGIEGPILAHALFNGVVIVPGWSG